MLTFKQWLLRQYGTTALKTTQKIITKYTNSKAANTKSSSS
jgi:hypothetical protein